MRITIRDTIASTLSAEMAINPNIIIIGEEVGKSNGTYKATNGLLEMYPGRVIDTPISEMGFTGLAVGASFYGITPVCEFMTWNFALQAIDHIVNSSAKMLYMSGGNIRSGIVFRGPNGYSPGVGAQHTQDFSAWYGSIPGLKVVAPYDAKDHCGILRKALRDNNPVVILENETLYTKEFEVDEPFGSEFMMDFKCVIEKVGSDVTIVGISYNLEHCIIAGDELANEGIQAEIINLLSIRPLDMETILKSVEKTKKILVVDNGWPAFSVASEICFQVYDHFKNVNGVQVRKLNGQDCPTAYAENLELLSFPTKDDILKIVRELLSK